MRLQLHVFSDDKRLLTAVDGSLDRHTVEALREALQVVEGHPLVVFGEPVEVVEHAYPLGAWSDVDVHEDR